MVAGPWQEYRLCQMLHSVHDSKSVPMSLATQVMGKTDAMGTNRKLPSSSSKLSVPSTSREISTTGSVRVSNVHVIRKIRRSGSAGESKSCKVRVDALVEPPELERIEQMREVYACGQDEELLAWSFTLDDMFY